MSPGSLKECYTEESRMSQMLSESFKKRKENIKSSAMDLMESMS